MSNSKQTEQDAWDYYDFQNQNNPLPTANPHRLPAGSIEQKIANKNIEDYRKQRDIISQNLHNNLFVANQQKTNEEVSAIGWGCILFIIVIVALAVLMAYSVSL